jgi:inner membrane protein
MSDPSPSLSTPPLGALLDALRRTGRKLRWVMLGFLLLVLQWPLSRIDGLVREREQRRGEATAEVMGHFGLAQTVVGPVLTVPYRAWTVEERQVGGKKEEVRRWHRRYAHFLPAELTVGASVKPEIRRRGLFEIPVYTGELELAGHFEAPDLNGWAASPEDILWQEAWLSMEVTDRRALTAGIQIAMGEDNRVFEVGVPEGAPLARSLQTRLSAAAARAGGPFTARIRLRGSERLAVAPLGGRTRLVMQSPWPHPSFDGAYLPERRSVTPGGFEAAWSVLRFGRDFGQRWTESALDKDVVAASAFGVSFKNPGDLYAEVSRSTRYSVLFLVMTFLVLYLWEVLRGQPVHPLQYLLFGCALALFYLLELALAEHLGFLAAYAAAAAGIVAVVALYARAIFADGKAAATLAAMLSALYAFLLVTLRSEDHALLLGALGLLVLLGCVMYASRRLHHRSEPAVASAAAPHQT